jgi:CRISPR-associated protein Cas5d
MKTSIIVLQKRMIERGGRRDVYLGTRECHGDVNPCVFGEEAGGAYDNINEFALGYMFHGFTYADEAVREAEKGRLSVRFHEVVMRRGIIEFPEPEKIPDKDRRILHVMAVKQFGEDYGNFMGLKEFSDEEAGL